MNDSFSSMATSTASTAGDTATAVVLNTPNTAPTVPSLDYQRSGSTTVSGKSNSSASNSTLEERLSRAWNKLALSAFNMLNKSEKADSVQRQATQQKQNIQDPTSFQNTIREALKQVDESQVGFLRTRLDFLRLLNHVEAKLQGKATEMESLETYIQTEPKIGTSRKRTHENMTPMSSTLLPSSGNDSNSSHKKPAVA